MTDRLQAGDGTAWAELFDEHRDRIWRYALIRTGNRDDADDITSQVFVEALQSIGRYADRGQPIIAWLYTIARNHTGKHLRRVKRLSSLEAVHDSFHPFDDEAVQLSEVVDALDSLTGLQAEVIALRYIAGYSTKELSAALGRSCSAVYSIEVRAIRALRRRLGIETAGVLSQAEESMAVRGVG